MKRYNPKDIEPRWQKKWEDDKTYVADFASTKPKYFGFGMFNYPSGAGIHVGHVRNYTIPDVVTRIKRQQGFETYQPVGWDSFGLPAENFAIKTGVSPQESTKKAIEKYRQQYRAMGWAVDWEKEINTTDPEYYKWTQWIFAKLFENDLAYQKESEQWWCPHDKTVLADEQVENGKCWRCGHEVEKKSLEQWFFKITDYADEMLEATNDLSWTDSVKASQKNWIGRSKGMIFTAPVKDTNLQIETFSAHFEAFRADTFVVIAPDHPFLPTLVKGTKTEKEVLEFADQMVKKRDSQGYVDEEDVEGVFTGRYIADPVGNGDLPIWVASYALAEYGTGIVKCSVHDERDFRFAKKYNLKLKPVLFPADPKEAEKVRNLEVCYTDMKEGILSEPDVFKGKVAGHARENIIEYLEEKQLAIAHTTYKMRDWLISRQRYWGAPIPIIHCPKDGPVVVPEKDLPVLLPEIKDYQPTGGNVSVLAGVDEWVNMPCPKCGKSAKRETDTMDGYVCSSWYFLRYLSPSDDAQAWDSEIAKKWMPVDFYNGADHATAHLLYARFFTRFFHKLGLVGTPEPFSKMVYNGKIKAVDGSAFSKSKGNGVDPLEIIDSGYGADALRLYEMFAAPVELDVRWDPQGVPGMHRFLSRTWTLVQEFLDSPKNKENEQSNDILGITHKMIKKVTEDAESDKFNTALAAMMEATNGYFKLKAADLAKSSEWQFAIESLLQLLAPFAPHITEELWHQMGNKNSIHTSAWPVHDEKYLISDKVIVVVQVNGKVRAQLEMTTDSSEEAVNKAALNESNVKKHLENKKIHKTIYVPNKLINLVVG